MNKSEFIEHLAFLGVYVGVWRALGVSERSIKLIVRGYGETIIARAGTAIWG